MFADYSHIAAESERHRAELIADAENFRLARLASRGRRSTPRGDPPPPVPPARNHEAERRYAVSR
jgi:hypothetical protein